ncbi:hypothetical protein [Halobaculum magnesiiphilum]|uniref:DUF8135 domain-containing protein n=1 Tax=Halobaculum magnesiiphilum TaxID=1017351 RepID=A0A8T8WG97_9EURY|nr:hypothetical protein [Halobaculum magnesiiphilum]QZP38861.1 hypothetical protein K6T50_06925 [Halobaculum magnesiiphilum]
MPDDRDRDGDGDRDAEADGDPRDEPETDGEGTPRVRNPFASDDPKHGDPDRSDDPIAGDSADATDAPRDRGGSAPLGDLARRVGENRSRDAAPGERDPFEEVDVGDIDTEALWESLDADDAASSDPDGLGAYDPPEGAAERVDESATRDRDTRPEHVLDKREYCQRCPYLSAPPEVTCGHDDTDIVEVVDGDRFRVRGCPMVTGEGRPDFAAVAAADADSAGGGTADAGASTGDGDTAAADNISAPDDA